MIGIGVTTTPSRNVLNSEAWQRFMPDNAKFEVYEDKALRGVASAKNALLKRLDDCDNIFLFDDDCWPISQGWWWPYVGSKEQHLMYQFNLPGNKLTEIYRDDKIVAYNKTRGCMLYITKKVLDTVGGMDVRYKNGYEHPDWTNRIHNAGLTTFRAMDVPDSGKLIYCMDQDGRVESSIKNDTKTDIANHRLYVNNKRSKEYMRFK